MLEAEWGFYKNNRDDLVEKYCGKHVVISGDKVVAAYDDGKEAYSETVKTIPLSSFMIHHILEEEKVIWLSPYLVMIKEVDVMICNLQEFYMIIGMDIILLGNFSIINSEGKTLFSFAIPPFENKTDLYEKASAVNKRNKL